MVGLAERTQRTTIREEISHAPTLYDKDSYICIGGSCWMINLDVVKCCSCEGMDCLYFVQRTKMTVGLATGKGI